MPQASPASPVSPPQASAAAPADRSQGTIVISARSSHDRHVDPIETVNIKSFGAVQTADRAVIGPAANVYRETVPSPLRAGIHNMLYNLREPTNFLNFVLQHHIGKAGETLARFTLNSTAGWLGIFDVAKRAPFKLPYRANGLEDTLGFYGVGPGPYMFLPLIGPTDVRDLIGVTVDRFSAPAALGGIFSTPEYGFSVTVIGGLDDRLRIAPQLRQYRDEAANPYRATRNFYLRRRQAEIDGLRGKPSQPATPNPPRIQALPLAEPPPGPGGAVLAPAAAPPKTAPA